MVSLKLFVLVVCLVRCTKAQPIIPGAMESRTNEVIPIASHVLDVMVPKILLLKYKDVPKAEGYKFNFKTSDGAYREERGIIMNPGTKQEELVVMGTFSYMDKDIEIVNMYTTDKKGYKPRLQIKKVSSKLRQSLVG